MNKGDTIKAGKLHIKIQCDFSAAESIATLKKLRNPKNRNTHPDDQIDALAEQFEYQGIRLPIIISNQSKKFVAGEGRFLAAEKLGMTHFPVSYQDFENVDAEWAFGIADNALQQRSILDFKGINVDIPEFGPIKISLLGIKDFSVDMSETETNEEEPDEKSHSGKECPSCGYTF